MYRSTLGFASLLSPAIVLVCLGHPAAVALTAQEVGQIAKSTTIRIVSQTAGSGVIIQRDKNTYTVLTAGHVVASEDNYEVITPDGARTEVTPSTIQRLPNVDLAVVQFQSPKSYQVVDIGNSNPVQEGTRSYVAGFPMRTQAISDSIYNFTEGKITANASRPLTDGYALVYSNNTLPGMSGGPVLDADGKLIGIHGRADTTEKVQDQNLNPDIYIKSGFNLGIPINTFATLAPKAGINIGVEAPAPQAPPTQTTADDLYLQAQAKIQKEDYKGAIADLDQALSLKPDYSAAFSSRGFAQARLSQASSSLADSEQALRLDPENAQAYLVRGLVRSRIGELDGALADANQGLKLNPKHPSGYGLRSTVKFLLADYPGAVADMQQTAVLMRSQGNTAGAQSVEKGLTVLKQLQPGAETFSQFLATAAIRLQLQDQKGAALDFQNAAAIALKQKEMGKFILAKSLLRSTDAALAQRYAAQENAQNAFPNGRAMVAQADQAIRQNPKDGNAYRLRGSILAEILEQPQQAIPDIQKAADYYQAQKDRTNYQLMQSYLKALQ